VIIPFGMVGAFQETIIVFAVCEKLMPPTLPGMSSRVTTVCVTENVLLPAAVSG